VLAHDTQEHAHHRPVDELAFDDVTEAHDLVVGPLSVLQDAVGDAGLRAQPGEFVVGDLCCEDVGLVGAEGGDELSCSEVLEALGVDLETCLLLALVRSECARVVDRLEARSAREFPDVARRVRHRGAELADQNDLTVVDVLLPLVKDDGGDVRPGLYDLIGLGASFGGDVDLGVQCPEEHEVPLGSDPEGPDHTGVFQDIVCQPEVGIPLLEMLCPPDEQWDFTLTVHTEVTVAEVVDRSLDCVDQCAGCRCTELLGVVAQVARFPGVLGSPEHDLAGILPDAPLDVGGQARKGLAIAGYPGQDHVSEVEMPLLPLNLVGVVRLEAGVALLVRAALRHENDTVEARLRQELECFGAPGGNAVLGGSRSHQEHRLAPRAGCFLACVHDGHCGTGHLDLPLTCLWFSNRVLVYILYNIHFIKTSLASAERLIATSVKSLNLVRLGLPK
jgi:hypothetical protein